MSAFDTYNASVERAKEKLGKVLIVELQRLLSIAQQDGEFYVCTGMGLCSLSCDKFKVIYKDEPELGPQDCTDDFEMTEKLRDDGPYGVKVVCSGQTREALEKVASICQRVSDDDLWVLPFRIYSNRIDS